MKTPLSSHKAVKCIYKILNVCNGLFYIGSTNDFHRRIHRHRSELKNNYHTNSYLQNAYNKYGIDNFEYFIVEAVSPETSRVQLFELEQKYIDVEKPRYNLLKQSSALYEPDYRSASEKNAKEYYVSYNGGDEYKIKNLRRFCRENNLRYNSARLVLSGEYSHTKNWQIRHVDGKYLFKPHVKMFKYTAQYKDEKYIFVDNLSDFCRKHDLSRSTVENVLTHKSRDCKGWRIRHIEEIEFTYKEKVKPFTKIVTFPDGQEESINNLNQFCEKHGLSPYAMVDVCRGKMKSHKGYLCRNIK